MELELLPYPALRHSTHTFN